MSKVSLFDSMENNYTESSGVETSPELNSSFEHSFPKKMPVRRSIAQDLSPGGGLLELDSSDEMTSKIQPRKLRFNIDECDEYESEPEQHNLWNRLGNCDKDKFYLMQSPKKGVLVKSWSQPAEVSISPPYRKVRALKLLDSPATPKTIIQKSTVTKTPLISSSSKHLKFLATNNNCGQKEALATPMEGGAAIRNDTKTGKFLQNRKSLANVNPFTPPALMMRNKKRLRQEEQMNNSLPTYTFGANPKKFSYFYRNSAAPAMSSVDEEPKQAPKRLALQDTNISRYDKEFVELELIGSGEFGLVYRCLNRLDGCVYAVKRSRNPVAGSTFE